MAKVLNYDLLVNDFEFHSDYYVQFRTNTLGKRTNSLVSPIMTEIVTIVFFYKDSFGVSKPTKVVMSLNKENKEIQI